MINTNGIRIAQDREFAARLAEYRQGFEVYLQFDSFRAPALNSLRAADLTRIHEQAIERLNELDISTTLVVTLKKGVNDDEIGQIIDYGLKQPCVRGGDAAADPGRRAGAGLRSATQSADGQRDPTAHRRAVERFHARGYHSRAVQSGHCWRWGTR